MAAYREAAPDQATFLDELVGAGLLIPSGVPGVYGRGAQFEAVRAAFNNYVTARVTEPVERLAFPPVMPREQLEQVGYLSSFPHLAASIFGFAGDEDGGRELGRRAAAGERWDELLDQSDLVLTPAACYPVYPAIAARGAVPAEGLTIDIGAAQAFRAEPAGDPARMQAFHMRELVRLGAPETIEGWRDGWRDRAVELLRELGLDARSDVATDPFFGRRGRMLAASQRDQALKFEIQVQIAGPDPTAVASFNYHQDHFGEVYGLALPDGSRAHTGCLGFGHERTVLALLRTHGLEPAGWPDAVRARLWPV